MRSSEVHLLILLASKGALSRPIRATTVDIASELNTSQQTASRWVLDLEKEGYLSRAREGLKLTPKSRAYLKNIYVSLAFCFSEKSSALSFEGELVEGFRESQHYLSLPEYIEQFEGSLGFRPYPGTMNLRIKTAEEVSEIAMLKHGVVLKGFTHNDRTYGSVECFPCRVNDKLEATIIVPDRNHYGPNILQLVSRHNLKKKLRLKMGDRVRVSV